MKNLSKSIALVSSVLAVSVIVSCAVLAWTEPLETAPAGNVAAPINTGGATQTKSGGLNLGNLNVTGNVGIGTASPSQKLDVAGTALIDYLRIDPQDGINEGGELQLAGSGSYGTFQIDNYQGNARIHTLGSGKQFQVLGGTIHVNGTGGNNYFAGNVGIGTASPNQKLDVAGYVKGQTGLCIDNDCRTAWPQEKICPAGQAITGFNKTTGAFTCGTSCSPSCTGKACGSDGCGGSCGTCTSGLVCNASGQCVSSCTPTCAGKACGSDGCGGSCGTCAANYICDASYRCAIDPTRPCSGLTSYPYDKRVFVTSARYNAGLFVTSSYNPQSDNFFTSSETIADNFCQDTAYNAGMTAKSSSNGASGSIFKALVYMGNRTDINSVLHGVRYWSCNASGSPHWQKIANDQTDMLSDNGDGNYLLANIYNELGNLVSVPVWTGYSPNSGGVTLQPKFDNGFYGGCSLGAASGGFNCAGWNCSSWSTAYLGRSDLKTKGWLDNPADRISKASTADCGYYSFVCWDKCRNSSYFAGGSLYCVEQ